MTIEFDPHSWWFEPPKYHELDSCRDCHEAGLHNGEIKKFADDCSECMEFAKIHLNEFKEETK